MKNRKITSFLTFENIVLFWALLVSVFAYSDCMTDNNIIPKQLYGTFAISVALILLSIKALIGKGARIDMTAASFTITAIAFIEASWSVFQWLMFKLVHIHSFILGSFDNPAGLISCLCLTIPFALYLCNIKSKYRIIAVIATAIITIAILVSQSRTGIIITALLLIDYYMRSQNKTLKLRISVIISLILILIIAAYFINRGSADGRLLIWQASWQMICDTPLCGFGSGAFERYYMDYQANWFAMNPDQKYTMLADNPIFAFNEYINLYLEFGVAGTLAVVALIILLITAYLKAPSSDKYFAGTSLLTLAFISFFSYPFNYPFTYIISLLSAYIIFRDSFAIISKKPFGIAASIVMLCIASFITVNVALRIKNEHRWFDAYQSHNLKQYESLLVPFNKYPHFLYSYAAELYQANNFSEALNIAQLCDSKIANYDVELLLGDIYMKLRDYDNAEIHYKKALAMCPCRFMPLNTLFDLYIESGETDKALQTARDVADKPVKVKSRTVSRIKFKMKQVLDASADSLDNKIINN